MKKAIELARKLKALADRGIDGEKETAQRMLERLMREHNITLIDIEGEEKINYYYLVRKEQDILFWHVVFSVIGSKSVKSYTVNKRFKNPQKFGIETTAAESIEIYAKFDFYWKLLQEEQKILLKAFVTKHKLYNKSSEGMDWDDLTEEQKEEYRRARAMATNLSDKSFSKRLENKN